MEAIISVICGAIGYLAATFWFRPMLRYYDLKHNLIVDLIFYANAINPEGMSDLLKNQHEKRILSLRKHSAEFLACYLDLPSWYKCILRKIKEEPLNASGDLMGLSNTCECDAAYRRVEKIKKYLRINAPI